MLHKLHRISALVIAIFAFFHLLNHLQAIQSVVAHTQFMEIYREFYYQPVLESILILCVIFQICSGVYFIKSRWGTRTGFFERVQALSGGYLTFFLLVHVSAVSVGRDMLNLDTNFYYAAAGMHIPPLQFFFFPYYFLAVVALFTHIGCAIHWLTRARLTVRTRNNMGYLIIGMGITISTLIIFSFGGGFYEITIPSEYLDSYQY